MNISFSFSETGKCNFICEWILLFPRSEVAGVPYRSWKQPPEVFYEKSCSLKFRIIVLESLF